MATATPTAATYTEPPGRYQRTPHAREPRADRAVPGRTGRQDLGLAGRMVVWVIALVLFGGGMIGWFFVVGLVEARVAGTFGVFGLGQDSASAYGVKEYLESSGLEEADITFLAEQYGMGIRHDAAGPGGGRGRLRRV